MGQKVNPNGLRLGINKDWEAKWYANKKDFSKVLVKDIEIRKYLEKNLKNAGIAKVEIERTAKRCEVVIHTSKPGVMIGRGGEEIEKLKKQLSKIADENVQISIVDIKKADMNAQLVADSIANQISNRASFRMAQKRAIRNAMKAGAKGIKTSVSGRLGGADMANGILTAREREIFELLIQNMTTKDIAKKLKISEKTIRNHISNTMQKLGVNGRAAAVVELLKLNELSL